MKNAILTLSLLALACLPASAGVVIEMTVKNAGSGGEAATDTIYAHGEMLRVDARAGRGDGEMSMIFRDDRFWIVERDKNECQTIDKETIEEIGSQVGAAMKQMEAELSKLPPEQRAMVEKMMKGKTPGMQKQAPPRRVEAGATEQVGDHSCVVHTVYAGAEKTREICAAPEGPSKLMSEAMVAFRAMAGFMKGLQENAQRMPFMSMDGSPFRDVEEIGGFPVRVRTFDDGQMTSESTLNSVARRDLDDAFFSPPKDCKVKDMAEEMKRFR